MLPILGIIGAALSAYALANHLAEPALKAFERTLKSKEEAARFLAEALDYEANNGQLKASFTKIPIKPGGGVMAYYQIKTIKTLNLIAIYWSGNIAIKSGEKPEWDWYTSPDSLNRLYEYFRTQFNNSAVRSVERPSVKAKDFSPLVKSVGGLQKPLQGLRGPR